MMNSKSEGYQRKKTHYRGIKIRITTDFLPGIMRTRKQWRDIFKSLKKIVNLEFFPSEKIFFKNKDFFSVKQKKRIHFRQTWMLKNVFKTA